MDLAVALTIGNVSFTLVPHDKAGKENDGDKEISSSSSSSIVSVKKLKSSSSSSKNGEGDVVIAELSGFTGTLRITQINNKDSWGVEQREDKREFSSGPFLGVVSGQQSEEDKICNKDDEMKLLQKRAAPQAAKDTDAMPMKSADNLPPKVSGGDVQNRNEGIDGMRGFLSSQKSHDGTLKSDYESCFSQLMKGGEEGKVSVGKLEGKEILLSDSPHGSQTTPKSKPKLVRGYIRNINDPLSTLSFDNEFTGSTYMLNAEKVSMQLGEGHENGSERSSSFASSSLAASHRIQQLDDEQSQKNNPQTEEENHTPSHSRKTSFLDYVFGKKKREGGVGETEDHFEDEPNIVSRTRELTSENSVEIIRDGPSTPESPTTALHTACASTEASLDELRALLQSDPEASCIADDAGRLPLHCPSQNEELLKHRRGRVLAEAFAWDLIHTYPLSAFEKDVNGHIPFTALIHKWVYDVHEGTIFKPTESELSNSIVQSLFSKLHVTRLNSNTGPSQEDKLPSTPPPKANVDTVPTTPNTEYKRLHRTIPSEVYITPSAEWSLNMLSAVLNTYRGAPNRDRATRREQLLRREELARNVASIPCLMKVLLLIEDDDSRNRVMDLSITRRIILCKLSVGKWIVHMLRSSGIPCRRVIDYFTLLSKMTVFDFIGKGRAPRQADFASFHQERDAVYDSVGRLSEIIPSLVVLERKEIERASTTELVWQILNDSISRPFVISIIMIDFVLHIVYMATFRFLTADYGMAASYHWVDFNGPRVPSLFVSVIGAHFLFRQLVQCISMALISRKVLFSYFFDFWNILDLSAVCLVIGSMASVYSYNTVQPWILSVTMLLLWLKLIGFLKGINMQLATFILAIGQIMQDIRWFLVVISIAIIAFSDMIHILKTTSYGGEFCDYGQNDTIDNDYCSQNLFAGYVRTYGIIIGDVSIETFRDTAFETVVFILFTFLAVIVLLNVLIAIVSDSYEKSRVKSAHLFGRARVQFAAENASLEAFLRPMSKEERQTIMRGCSYNWNRKEWFYVLNKLGRLCVLLSILTSAVFTDILLIRYLAGYDDTGSNSIPNVFITTFLIILLLIILNVAIIVVVEFLIKNLWNLDAHIFALRASDEDDSRDQQFLQKYVTFFVRYTIRFVSERVFGIKHRATNSSDDNGDSDWAGRLNYLEQLTTRIVSEAECRIKEHDTSISMEIKEGIGTCIDKIESLT